LSLAPGARATAAGTRFTVRSHGATALTLCLFEGDREERIAMAPAGGGLWSVDVPGAAAGSRYGLRADGPWSPDRGLRFDPAKLLVDPHAQEIDRPFAWDRRLALPRERAVDTSMLVPKAIVPGEALPAAPAAPLFRPGGLIYELNVRGFTMRHRAISPEQRGTVAALAHPAIIAHLQRLRVGAIELMPVTAAIDERHLAPLGLRNAWGYNPVVPMALDPRLCPGGVAELAETVSALRAAGIGVILDLVFNHTGEGDHDGPVLSLRGFDSALYYAHETGDPGRLVNDTGTGNTLACWRPEVRALVLDSLRHFAALGVDGFRFDLAPVLARGPDGFDPAAPIFAEIAADPLLADRILIAEPWDIGPGGYQLGRFPPNWLEWNDRFRDDVRRFWRGDPYTRGALATRIAGSSDVFGPAKTRSVNFFAAHDGFTLADLVAHERKHNEANGEGNRDGHDQNHSWNNGAEGGTDDPAVLAGRAADQRALLATLFASRGTIMLAAGDEFGRSQGGNNNAYAQDNETSWIDWDGRDLALEAFTAGLAAFRTAHPAIAGPAMLGADDRIVRADWLGGDDRPLEHADWEQPQAGQFRMRLVLAGGGALTLTVDRAARAVRWERD
jgi:glycogen debranching enzyme